MSLLHMVSLPLDLADFRRWAAQRGHAEDEGRALHHLLAETFGKAALQPFRLMVAPRSRTASLYAYCRGDPDSLRRTAEETGLPDALALCPPERLAHKSMPEAWEPGRRLAFDLRARPVVRLMQPAGTFRKGAEIDAYLAEALRLFPDGQPDAREDRLRRDLVYADWLSRRLEGAARLEGLRLVRQERRRVHRQGRVEGPDIVVHGEMTVLDSEAFSRRLSRGVGRHVAYGYGMLLLRPAGR